MSTKNARFWIWENNGWIKLTLCPGQELTWTVMCSICRFPHIGLRVNRANTTSMRNWRDINTWSTTP